MAFLYSLDFEYEMCRRKEKCNPRLTTDTVLWWLQPTTEMGLASGFETYLTAYCSYQKQKKTKLKNIKKKRCELTPRYQRVRPKYGQSALHLSSGREHRQALSGAHEALHPAGIAFCGLTA